MRFGNLPTITQPPIQLPLYVPMIHHKYKRSTRLQWPIVAIETYQVFRLVKGEYRAIAESPEELRKVFALHPKTQIVLRGTAEDSALERYWSYRRRDKAPAQLARLGILLAIGPNFSHFLDVPRTDNLFNRKRQLICLAEMQDAGLTVAPHLSACMPGDWAYWNRFFLSNSTICTAAI